MKYADGPTAEVQVLVEASLQQVWDRAVGWAWQVRV